MPAPKAFAALEWPITSNIRIIPKTEMEIPCVGFYVPVIFQLFAFR